MTARLAGNRFLLVAVLISTAVYTLTARLLAGDTGYPLDDSWIHQTLARNFSTTAQWSINPGEPAAVSTSPLWTLLIALGYWLALPPLAWSMLLGVAALGLVGWTTQRLGQRLFPADEVTPWLGALLVVVEWHLVWASLSGMETVLFTALSLALLDMSLRPSPNPLRWGLLAGLLVATRPEGVLLGGLILLWRLLRQPASERWRWLAAGLVLAGMAGLLLALNTALSGQPLPATFYAKHATYGAGPNPLEYARYLLAVVVELARGPMLLLYPGLLYAIARGLRDTHQDVWLPLAWVALLLGVYALWLPAVYHHGRYLIPLLPLLLLFGLHGSRQLVRAIPSRLLPPVALGLLALVAATSWVRGAQVYAENVQFINQQQVALAQWIATNTPPDAVVASHDIGALGYYGGRRVVDVAGLATGELTQSPRDVDRVLAVLQEHGVTYILIQPNWYPRMYAAITDTPGSAVVQEGPATPYGEGNSFQVLRSAAK